MGAGYHGNFGQTSGTQYRIGVPVQITEKTYEMALNYNLYIKKIIKKYNIHLKGSGKHIEIIYNPNMKIGIAGKVSISNPLIIELGPSALVSEYELANTIAHELNHSRSYLKHGYAREKPAYASGNKLEKYMRGKC